MAGNYEMLATTVIGRYITPLLDRRLNPLPQNLTLLNRTPEVEKTDGEILATSVGQVFAADIIADDQAAVVHQADQFTLQQNKIPNLKHGALLTQEMLNLLNRLDRNQFAPGEDNVFRGYITRKLDELVRGINIRKNALLWQAALNNGTYNRLGIKISGFNWGAPSDVMLTVDPLWTDPVNATPIADIQNFEADLSGKYGKTYNRVTLSTSDFLNAIATAEFKARVQTFSTFQIPTGGFPGSDIGLMSTLMGRILNKIVEIDDFQYAEQAKDGSKVYTRFKPEGKVVLSNTSDDNNPTARDIANAVVTETIVGSLPGVNVLGGGGLGVPRVGPVGYATVPGDLNPPNVTLWAVQRCLPEKLDRVETAVLTVA